MNSLPEIAASNAIIAGLFAVGVFVLGKIRKRPALMHALWTLVMLKLLMPPVFPLLIPWESDPDAQPNPVEESANNSFHSPASAVVPSPKKKIVETNLEVNPKVASGGFEEFEFEEDLMSLDSIDQPAQVWGDLPKRNSGNKDLGGPREVLVETDSQPAVLVAETSSSDSIEPEGETPTLAESVSATPAAESTGSTTWISVKHLLKWCSENFLNGLFWLWGFGTVAMLGLTVSRIHRFRRLLKFAEPASESLQLETQRLARTLGLSRCPELWTVPGRVSPMLWTFERKARVLFPRKLIEQVDPERRATLITHELAHYRRGDHWVRILELTTTLLYWWHPVVWWARREIQIVEEECCDAWVVRAIPHGREVYATALVEVLGFLSEKKAALPPTASGVGYFDTLRQRVTMIMAGNQKSRLSQKARWVVSGIALVLLSLWPTLASEMPAADPETKEASRSKSSSNDSERGKSKPKAPSTPKALNPNIVLGPNRARPTEFEPRSRLMIDAPLDLACVAYSPDGKYLATGSGFFDRRGELILWDRKTRKPVFRHSHRRGIRSVAFSHDGKSLATGNFDRTAKLIDIPSGKVVHTFPVDKNGVNSVAFSPDDKILATGGLVNEVILWDAETGKEIRQLKGHAKRVLTVAFSPDGKTVVSAGDSGVVRVWEASSGREIQQLTGHSDGVEFAAFSPDGKWIATASWDSTIRVWDTKTWESVATIPGQAAYYCLAFSPDSQMLLAGDSGGRVVLWDVAEQTTAFSTAAHTETVYGVAFSPNGREFASVSFDKTLKLWATEERKLVASLPKAEDFETLEAILSVATSPDGKLVASTHEDRTIRLRDAKSGSLLRSFLGHEDVTSAIVFSPDGKLLASAGYDHEVKLWDVSQGEQTSGTSDAPPLKKRFQGHTNWIFGLQFSPDGKMLVSGGYDKTIRIWDVASGEQRSQLDGHTAAVRSVAISPDGKWLASGGSDKSCRIWNLKTHQLITTLTGHEGAVRTIAFSPNGLSLASGGEDNAIKLWDVSPLSRSANALANWKPDSPKTLNGHTGMVWCLAFSPTGNTLVSGGFDNVIRVWDPNEDSPIGELKQHTDAVTSLAFTPDGQRLLSGSYDRTLRRWGAMRPAILQLAGISAHARPVTVYVAFTPDGKRMVTASRNDPVAKIWDMESGQVLHELSDHKSGVRMAALSPDGTIFATATPNQFIRLWDVETGDEIRRLTAHGAIRGLAFSPDGKRLASASNDKTARIWEVETGKVLIKLPAQKLELRDVVFSPDGKLLVTTAGSDQNGSPGDLKLWDAETGKELAKLNGHNRRVNMARFSPDGKLLASVSNDRNVNIWDVATRRRIKTLRFGIPRATTAVVFLDNERIAVGNGGGDIWMWEAKTGRRLGRFQGHKFGGNMKTAFVWSLALSPDKTILASASSDIDGYSVRLWPLVKNRRLSSWAGKSEASTALKSFAAHGKYANGIVRSPNGKWIITGGGQDHTAKIWDAKTLFDPSTHSAPEPLASLTGHKRGISCIAFSPDSRFVVTGSLDTTLKFWEMEQVASSPAEPTRLQPKLVDTMTRHTDSVRRVIFSPDGKYFISTGSDKTVRFWDTTTRKELRSFPEMKKPVLSIAFLPDGEHLLLGTGEHVVGNPDNVNFGSIQIWNLEDLKLVSELPQSQYQSTTMALSSDGRFLAGRNPGNTAAIWTTETRQIHNVLERAYKVYSLKFSPDNRLLAVASLDSSVSLWDPLSGQRVAQFTDHENPVRDVCFSEDGRSLISMDLEGVLKLWKVPSPKTKN